uniref:Fic family protein n=1 Tax=Roseivirga sp. TaxID=1964215 RepID=UPI0040481212
MNIYSIRVQVIDKNWTCSVMYDRNVPFNELPFLPPPEEVISDSQILLKLVSASRALATMNANVLRLPNPSMLINTIALHEARTSTAIENIFTTEDELYKAISADEGQIKTEPSVKEVLRYREALWAGFGHLKSRSNIDLEMMINVFQEIKNTSAGIRPPQALVVIKRGQSEFRAGEIIYTPPRGEALVEKYLNNLIEFMQDDVKYNLDPLLKMCIAHYQFEAIHPFQDGNGRTGRILNLLFLVNKGLLSLPVLYLSKYIITYKDDYYYNLGAVTQRGAWKTWILFMLDAIEQTSNLTNQLVNDIIDQMEKTLIHGKQKIKWYGKELNEAIFSQPYNKPKNIGEITGKSSRTTLTKYMEELVNAGILTPKKDGKEVYYLNDDLIRILEG